MIQTTVDVILSLVSIGSTKIGSVGECREAIEELKEFSLAQNIGNPKAINSILDTFIEAGFLDQVILEEATR